MADENKQKTKKVKSKGASRLQLGTGLVLSADGVSVAVLTWAVGLIPATIAWAGAAVSVGLGTFLEIRSRKNTEKANLKKAKKEKKDIEPIEQAEENINNIQHQKVQENREAQNFKENKMVEPPHDKDQMSKYRTNKIEPATFIVYEMDGEKVKSDSRGLPMMFKISKNTNEYMQNIFGYIQEENLGDCKIRVVDENNVVYESTVRDGQYEKTMRPIFGKTEEISRALSVKNVEREMNFQA